MARHLKVPVRLMEDFQRAFFKAYPAIPKWHHWIAEQLQRYQKLENAWGMTRHFFGRASDDATLREAIAFRPQSSTAVRLNLGLYRLWKWLLDNKLGYLTAQVHDAVYFQYRPEKREVVVPKALDLIGNIPLYHKNRRFTVPGEAKIGFNWANYDQKKNPNGLKKWKPGMIDNRKRETIFDRILT